MTEHGVVTVRMTRAEHQRSLAYVRKLAMLRGDVEAEELLELLEVDRPARELYPLTLAEYDKQAGREPLASRRASLDEGELLVRAMNAVRPGRNWADDRREKITNDEHSFGL